MKMLQTSKTVSSSPHKPNVDNFGFIVENSAEKYSKNHILIKYALNNIEKTFY